VPNDLNRCSLTLLCERANHGLFGLGKQNNEAILTPEVSEGLASHGPNRFHNTSA
jgi:hypothetical protein